MTNSTLCPSDNFAVEDQEGFWSTNGIDWDAHRIGWLIAGVCTAVVRTLVFFRFEITAKVAAVRGAHLVQCTTTCAVSVLDNPSYLDVHGSCRHYTNPAEQRQMYVHHLH